MQPEDPRGTRRSVAVAGRPRRAPLVLATALQGDLRALLARSVCPTADVCQLKFGVNHLGVNQKILTGVGLDLEQLG